MAKKILTRAPEPLAHYTTPVLANATVEVATIEAGPNSSLCILAKGDESFQVRVTDQAAQDDEDFQAELYDVTEAAPATIYHDTSGQAKIEIVNGSAALTPDVRVFPRAQS